MKQFVLYTRVSTRRQGDSGLGLAAQKRDIDLYLQTYVEIPWEIIGEFQDIESGANGERPELWEAIKLNRPQFAGGSKVSMDGAYGKK